MLDRLSIPFALPLKDALFMLSQSAAKQGAGDVSKKAADIAASIDGDRHFRIKIAARQIFACACDYLRADGAIELAECLDQLVREIRSSDDLVVTGVFNFAPKSIGELDDALEKVRKKSIEVAGG